MDPTIPFGILIENDFKSERIRVRKRTMISTWAWFYVAFPVITGILFQVRRSPHKISCLLMNFHGEIRDKVVPRQMGQKSHFERSKHKSLVKYAGEIMLSILNQSPQSDSSQCIMDSARWLNVVLVTDLQRIRPYLHKIWVWVLCITNSTHSFRKCGGTRKVYPIHALILWAPQKQQIKIH